MQASANGRFGLSPEQTSAVIGTQNVFIKACPGSGKTRSVAGRVAWMMEEQKSLALLSFTRVGAEEISRATTRDHGVSITGDNYVGTVQSFLQKYVLTPFAHLETGASVGVRIDPEQVEEMDPAGVQSSKYGFRIDGTLEGKPSLSTYNSEQVKNAKYNSAKQGFVGLNDDVYWSYITLLKHPDIAKALADRFDEIIVDEAQDLDVLQIECLRLLKRAGLSSLILVGDYDQTIYEWRGSNIKICEEFAKDVGLEPLKLTENYRSSQVICDVASKFRNTSVPDKAVGDHAGCGIRPVVIRYSSGHEQSLHERLYTLAAQRGLSPESAGILVSSQAMKSAVTGVNVPTLRGAIKTLLSIKQSATGPSLADYKEIERILCRRAFGSATTDANLDWHVVRAAAISLVDNLPDLVGNLLEWAAATENVLTRVIHQLAPAFNHTQRPGPAFPTEWSDFSVLPTPVATPQTARVDTVFAVKGESIDAVMLVASTPDSYKLERGFDDASSWIRHLSYPTSLKSEKARVAYVAITRAQRLFVLALPDSTDQIIFDLLEDAGFELDSN